MNYFVKNKSKKYRIYMAGLNTLRTKFGLILSIVIGLALLAFILTLFLENGSLMGGSDPKVGTINGEKVSYTTLANTAETMRIRYAGGQSLNSEQQDQINEMAWQQLVSQYALMPGFETLGIEVSEEERVEMMSGKHISPAILQSYGSAEALQQHFADASVKGNEAKMQQWVNLVNDLKQSRQMEKFSELVAGSVFVNDLEVANGVKAANQKVNGQWVGRRYNAIPDSLINISASEIKTFYNNNKRMFKQTPSRTINYVVFDVVP